MNKVFGMILAKFADDDQYFVPQLFEEKQGGIVLGFPQCILHGAWL